MAEASKAKAKAKPNPVLQFFGFVINFVLESGCAVVFIFLGIILFVVIRVMFGKMSLWTSSAIIACIISLWTLATPSTWRPLFEDEYPKTIADRATKVLLKGIDAAIDELWGEYGDQLSV